MNQFMPASNRLLGTNVDTYSDYNVRALQLPNSSGG
jgi:hypothetical protein